MSVSVVYYWRLKCLTDNKDEYVWSPTEPTVCPTNSTHTIDSNLTVIVNKIEQNEVKIKEDEVPTNGIFRAETIAFTASPGTTVYNYTRPYAVVLYNVIFVTSQEMQGDIFNARVAPNTTIGASVAPINPGDTVIYVSPTVITYTHIGDLITITDGVNSEEFYLININKSTNNVTLEKPIINGYSPLSPTYIQLSNEPIKNYEIGVPAKYEIGKKIGGKYIPANLSTQITYENKGLTDKRIIYQVEFTY